MARTYLFRLALPAVALALLGVAPTPARADFFDDMRKTFTSDMPRFFQQDVPHFFQDDIPCAFGGQPTSGTKKSCNAPRGETPKPEPRQNSEQGPSDGSVPAPPPQRGSIEQKELPPR